MYDSEEFITEVRLSSLADAMISYHQHHRIGLWFLDGSPAESEQYLKQVLPLPRRYDWAVEQGLVGGPVNLSAPNTAEIKTQSKIVTLMGLSDGGTNVAVCERQPGGVSWGPYRIYFAPDTFKPPRSY